MTSAFVAPLKGDCVICQAPEPVRLAVNMAIWPAGTDRAPDYRARGVAAMAAVAGATVNVKTITRHADHVERQRRVVSPEKPMDEDRHERPVVSTDFLSVTEKAAKVGMLALERIEQNIESLDAKEAIAVSRLGVAAAAKAEDSRLKRGDQRIELMAIFAAAAGMGPAVGHVPEVRNVTPVESLKAEIAAERERLMIRAGWHDGPAEPDDLPPL